LGNWYTWNSSLWHTWGLARYSTTHGQHLMDRKRNKLIAGKAWRTAITDKVITSTLDIWHFLITSRALNWQKPVLILSWGYVKPK
jgi:hypothetical protein